MLLSDSVYVSLFLLVIVFFVLISLFVCVRVFSMIVKKIEKAEPEAGRRDNV